MPFGATHARQRFLSLRRSFVHCRDRAFTGVSMPLHRLPNPLGRSLSRYCVGSHREVLAAWPTEELRQSRTEREPQSSSLLSRVRHAALFIRRRKSDVRGHSPRLRRAESSTQAHRPKVAPFRSAMAQRARIHSCNSPVIKSTTPNRHAEVASNHSIERTCQGPLRAPCPAAHVER